MLPTGAAARKYIRETIKLMNGWTNNSPLKDIAFKAIHIMPSLLLQKLSKPYKAKDHLKALERRTDLWINGRNIDELYLRARQFNHVVYITSTNQKASVDFLRNLLY